MKAGQRRAVWALLLWLACPPARADNLTSTDAPRPPGSTEPTAGCREDSDCGDAREVACDRERGSCRCRQPDRVLSESGHCLIGARLGKECVMDEQCRLFDANSTCLDNVCGCPPGFTLVDEQKGQACQLEGDLFTTQTSGEEEDGAGKEGGGGIRDKNVLIILIVFGLMFIGICVALNMFSRARFRNNRSIFSNPHPRLMHIKLGKKKGHRRGSHASMQGGSRQPSVCSQLSPLPSRAGSRRPSQQSLRSNPDGRPDRPGGATVLSVDEIAKKLQDSPRRPSTSGGPVQNGPNSPTIIVTNAPARRQEEPAGLSSSPVNV